MLRLADEDAKQVVHVDYMARPSLCTDTVSGPCSRKDFVTQILVPIAEAKSVQYATCRASGIDVVVQSE